MGAEEAETQTEPGGAERQLQTGGARSRSPPPQQQPSSQCWETEAGVGVGVGWGRGGGQVATESELEWQDLEYGWWEAAWTARGGGDLDPGVWRTPSAALGSLWAEEEAQSVGQELQIWPGFHCVSESPCPLWGSVSLSVSEMGEALAHSP